MDFKKNLIAKGFPKVPVVVVIPVIIPENPLIVLILEINSTEDCGVVEIPLTIKASKDSIVASP